MEGFKSLPKMQCFKEGGSVQKQIANYEKREHKTEEKADMAQDKAIVKKAIGMHDKQEHKGEKTDLTKLRKGGRAKKDCGTVKKYKAGGAVTNVYEAKKKSGDLDNIRKTKDIKPGKAAAPSKAAVKPAFAGSDVAKEKSKLSGHKDLYIKSKQSGKKAAAPSGAKGPDAYKKGGKVKKMQAGGGVKNPQALVDKLTAEDNAADKALIEKPVKAIKDFAVKGYETVKNALTGQGSVSDAERNSVNNINKKKGGKIKKFADGGSTGEYAGDDPIVRYRMNQINAEQARNALAGNAPIPTRLGAGYMPNANPAMDNRDVGAAAPALNTYLANANPAMDNRDVGMRRPMAVRPSANYIPNKNPLLDNRDVAQYRAPNVEEDMQPYNRLPKGQSFADTLRKYQPVNRDRQFELSNLMERTPQEIQGFDEAKAKAASKNAVIPSSANNMADLKKLAIAGLISPSMFTVRLAELAAKKAKKS